MTIITLGQLKWQSESPSFFKLLNHDIRLVFDGALWWLYSINRTGSSMHFETRSKAVEWIEHEIKQMKGVSNVR